MFACVWLKPFVSAADIGQRKSRHSVKTMQQSNGIGGRRLGAVGQDCPVKVATEQNLLHFTSPVFCSPVYFYESIEYLAQFSSRVGIYKEAALLPLGKFYLAGKCHCNDAW